MPDEPETEILCVGGPLHGTKLRRSSDSHPPPFIVLVASVELLREPRDKFSRPAGPHYERVTMEHGYEYHWVQSAAEEDGRG